LRIDRTTIKPKFAISESKRRKRKPAISVVILERRTAMKFPIQSVAKLNSRKKTITHKNPETALFTSEGLKVIELPIE
jgi:hypothetical protein